ncbi:hypothetical protein MLD38_036691 [Melastoma candidum]|uniref:Uncharacterized protein n=1 Tax=Melastoma candidum TaxID=119954 RepID=A0ACB9LKJ5_9MYRT|nr:hypothetical protein MLD38_036691 [Melastoma candidum]
MILEMDQQPFEHISVTDGGDDIGGGEEFQYLKSQSEDYVVAHIQHPQEEEQEQQLREFHQSQIIAGADDGHYNNDEDHIHAAAAALADEVMAQSSNSGQLFPDTSHWDANLQLEELYAHQGSQQVDMGDHADENFSSPVILPPPNPLYPQTTGDVSDIFQLSSSCAPPDPSSMLPNSASLSFPNLVDDHHLPLLHLSQLPPHPPFMGDLFQPPPFSGSSMVPACGSVFGNYMAGDDGEGCGPGMFIGDKARVFDNTVFEFGRDIDAGINPKRARKGGKTFTTERDRRSQLKERYGDLRQLIPSPTKNDRASVVGDAIQYIEELKRTVNELRFLIDKKQRERERTKRQKIEDDAVDNGVSGDGDSSITKLPMGNCDNQSPYSGTALRSSWLQRKSKATEIDVRIVDDEVTIKILQRKKINCLLHVSRVLDELQLDIHHIAGGHIGEHYSFLFNTKIYEGSSVYASAIASRLMEVVDGQYAATPSCGGY